MRELIDTVTEELCVSYAEEVASGRVRVDVSPLIVCNQNRIRQIVERSRAKARARRARIRWPMIFCAPHALQPRTPRLVDVHGLSKPIALEAAAP